MEDLSTHPREAGSYLDTLLNLYSESVFGYGEDMGYLRAEHDGDSGWTIRCRDFFFPRDNDTHIFTG